jgi:thiol-disulfide isomerase/thioredoxin
MVKQKIFWQLYLISGIFTFIILIIGIYFGVFLGKSKINVLEKNLDDLRINQEDAALGFTLMSIFGNKTCNVIHNELSSTVAEASDIGKEITKYEQEEKFRDSRYISLKRDYTLIQIKYWSYLETMKSDCNNTNFVTILYFYSNDCSVCSGQGLILDYVKKLHPDSVMIFALDSDVDLNTLKMVKDAYGIKEMPTLIINDEKYSGLVSLDELKQIICNKIGICD